jgi:hypothetical protein
LTGAPGTVTTVRGPGRHRDACPPSGRSTAPAAPLPSANTAITFNTEEPESHEEALTSAAFADLRRVST